jgi:asparagine synthase (glutamine-hydrolysing)
LAISANVKIKSGYGKWILRDIMKGRVPDFIRLERKKRGFDVTRNWINEGVGNALRDIIFSKREVLEEYLIPGIDLERSLSNKAMESNRLVLDEALMLAWLANPYLRN